jgi:hypothetical protein
MPFPRRAHARQGEQRAIFLAVGEEIAVRVGIIVICADGRLARVGQAVAVGVKRLVQDENGVERRVRSNGHRDGPLFVTLPAIAQERLKQ